MDRSKWEYKKLGEVAKFINGDRGVNYPSQSDFVEVGIPFINAGHLKNNTIDFSSMNYITREKFGKLGSGKIQKGDLLFCLRGSLGKKAIVDNIEEGAIASSLVILRPSAINTHFLSYYLESPLINDEIERSNNGSSQPNLSAKSVSQFLIPIPKDEDQQRIVAELDCLNEMIALKQEQLKEFDKLALAIFHDMFGDSVINSKGWPTDKIENVISEKSYRGTINNEDGQVWLLNLDMVESNTGRILEKLFVSTEKTDGSVTTFNEEYVLYSKLRPYLNKVVLPDSSGYCTTELVTLLPNKDKLNRYYVAYLLRSESFVNYICGKVAGAKMPRVSMKEFRTFSIPLPPLALQQQFAEKIQAIEAQKELVKKSIAETQHLLDSRMDFYFN